MKKLTIAVLAVVMTMAAGGLWLNSANAAVINCAVAPYCPGDVVVPAPHNDASVTDNGQSATSEILIDIDEPLPFSVTFESSQGGVITFIQRIADHTADVTTTISSTEGQAQPLLTNSWSFTSSAPKGFAMVKQYRVNRSGDGAISVIHTVREPNAKPYTETIPVHVH